MNAARAAAQLAAAAGLSVVPPRGDGSKAPIGEWKVFQSRPPTDLELDALYANDPTGVGVVCGAVSGGLEMLEFEGRAVNEQLPDRLRELARAAGLDDVLARIYEGYYETTPSGGGHLLYLVPTPLGNTKLASRPATESELAANPTDKVKVLIETRGEGGYCIVAPSSGAIHPTGGAWTLVSGGFDRIAAITNTERDDLWDLARLLDAMPDQPAQPIPTDHDGNRPGDRFNAAPDVQERVLAALLAHGWTRVFRRGDTVFLRRPGKDRSISASLGHVGPGVLRVFSTSTEFEAKAHTPFSVYTILEHGGDFVAAAAALTADDGVTFTVTPATAKAMPEPGVPESTPWPDPPADAAYHGVLGDIARAVAPYTEADPVAVLGTGIAMFGAACGDGPMLYQGSRQRTNLSLLLVGETGFRGRKGTALDVERGVFALAYPDLAGLWLVGVASGEAITGHLGRHELEERVLIVETEFGRLLTIMNREGSTLSAVLRNAWDGVPLGHARARDESLVTRHHVTLLGHITPVELRAKLTDTDAANGFANRLLFLAVRRTRLVPFPASPDEHVREFIEPLHRAIVEARVPRELFFDVAAHGRWTDFYAELARAPRLGLAGAVTGRHEAQVARLALVYAVADRSTEVGLVHLEAAIALADYARRSATWALGDSTGNRHADVLRRMLDDGEIGWKEAKIALGLRTAADMAEAVAVLVDAGLAELVPIAAPGGGRPRRVLMAKGAKGAKDAGGARTEERGNPA